MAPERSVGATSRLAEFAVRCAALLSALFLLDVLFAGPRGLWSGWHVRHALFVAASTALVVAAVLEWRRRGDACLALEDPYAAAVRIAALCLGLGAWSLPWTTIVPALRGVPFSETFADADALLMLVPIAAAILVLHPSFDRVRRFTVVAILVLAGGHVTLWCLGLLAPRVGSGAARWMTELFGKDGMYVGPLRSGTFRVLWIASQWCLLGLFWVPTVFRGSIPRWLAAIVMATALVSTRSRGLWIGAAAGLVVALMVRFADDRRRLASALLLALAGLIVLALASPFVRQRLSQLDPRVGEVGMRDRAEQIEPLLTEWGRFPIVGKGFGARASLVRSVESPYSYEMTALALLMKMGVVGVAGIVAFWTVVFRRVLSFRSRQPAEAASLAGATAALFVAWNTNPLFLNFVGMTIFGCLMLHLAVLAGRASSMDPQ